MRLDQPKMLFQMSDMYLGEAEYFFSRCISPAESIQTNPWNTIVYKHTKISFATQKHPVMLLNAPHTMRFTAYSL
jgi:hypothetical protein